MAGSSFKTRSALLLSGARATSLLGFVVATALLSRALTTAQYGTFRQCWTVYSIALPILSTGIAQSLFFFVPRIGRPGHWGFVRRSILSASALGLLAAAMMAAGAPLLARAFGNPDAVVVYTTFAIFMGASIPLQLSDAVFMSVGRTGLAALFNVLNRSTVLVGLALPIALWGIALRSGLLVLGTLQLSAVAMMWPLANLAHRPKATDLTIDGSVSLTEQLRYAWPIVGASVFGALFLQLDKLVVGFLGSPEEFAIYSNGAFENPIVALFVAAAGATAAAELVKLRASGDNAGFLVLWTGLTERLALVLLPMGIFLAFFAQEVVVILFSQRYAASADVFRAYVSLTPVRLIAFSTVFAALDDNIAYLAGHVIAGMTILVSAPLLYAFGGSQAVAISVVLVSYGLAGGFLKRVASRLGCRFSEVVPLTRIAMVSAVSLGAAALSRAVVTGAGIAPATSAVALGASLFGALTAAGLYRLGLLRAMLGAGAAER